MKAPQSQKVQKMTRPPSERGQGRKRLPDEARKKQRSIRMTDAVHAQFMALGGAEWFTDAVLLYSELGEKFKTVGGVQWLKDAVEVAYKHSAAAQKENPPS